MAKVFLIEDAREDLRGLDKSARIIVAKGLIKLQDEPEKRGLPLGSQATSDLTGLRKLVVGNRDYRIVFRVEDDGSVCVVWVIGRRADSEVYQIAAARLKTHSNVKLVVELSELVESAFATSTTTFERL
jgi:mRNA interferase RelE/StbE